MFDIIKTHNTIKSSLSSNRKKFETFYQYMYVDIDDEDDMPHHLIEFIKSFAAAQTDYYYYVLDSAPIIDDFITALNTPIKVSFYGKQKNEHKERLENMFLLCAAKYHNSIPTKHQKDLPCQCLKQIGVEYISNNMYVCINCGTAGHFFTHTTSIKDSDRIKMTMRYTSDQPKHFKDAFQKYVEMYNIPYDIEMNIIRDFSLLIDTCNKNINNGYISKLCDENRTNFLNRQYISYVLLRKYGIKCKKEDFVMLKTADRKRYHDTACEFLFNELGWGSQFRPVF